MWLTDYVHSGRAAHLSADQLVSLDAGADPPIPGLIVTFNAQTAMSIGFDDTGNAFIPTYNGLNERIRVLRIDGLADLPATAEGAVTRDPGGVFLLPTSDYTFAYEAAARPEGLWAPTWSGSDGIFRVSTVQSLESSENPINVDSPEAIIDGIDAVHLAFDSEGDMWVVEHRQNGDQTYSRWLHKFEDPEDMSGGSLSLSDADVSVQVLVSGPGDYAFLWSLAFDNEGFLWTVHLDDWNTQSDQPHLLRVAVSELTDSSATVAADKVIDIAEDMYWYGFLAFNPPPPDLFWFEPRE
jgi:hypothetical protein